MKMIVDAKKLKRLIDKEFNGSTPKAAKAFGVEYSHLYRVVNGAKNGGSKVLGGLMSYCTGKNLNFNDYVFLTKPLSINKTKTG